MAKQPKQHDIIRDHTYDGIEEYDNKLPLWWQAIFYCCIVAAIIYVGIYHVGSGKVGAEDWAEQTKLAQAAALERSGGVRSEEDLRALLTDSGRLAAGKELFNSANGQCATCHLTSMTGSIGPNLLDDYWLHGSDLTEIIELVTNGSPNGQMPVQGTRLSSEEITNLALYIVSENKKNPSPPEGVRIRPEEEVEAPILY